MKQGFIALFCRHRVAANLLMIIMIMLGTWALSKLNTQFFPTFELDVITVRVVWSGASAEDVETSITLPLEQELRGLDHLHKITSTSATGVASITLEYQEGTNMDSALEKVNSVVDRTRQLPTDAEDPIITRIVRYEGIASILLTGADNLSELRYLAQQIKDDLIARGVSKVDITGLPEEEVAIQVPTQRLYELGLTLEDIAQRVRQQSKDIPSGSVGRNDTARQLRALDQRRSVIEFEGLPVISDNSGRLLSLGDIASIERRAKDNEVRLTYNGKPAVELSLSRDENMDTLKSARILDEWLTDHRATLPGGVTVHVFDQRWVSIKERISLLLTNGGGGLILVIAILLLFLNRRVAFWVTMGIPVSFMAALAVLYLFGGSINMISLFGLIMALGIIVDDAIVVGEDALTHHQMGEPPALAAEGGALRMLAPVVSSSLTTIAAFLPLMLVSGIVGNIMFDIPLVVICVIIASLIECFLILPGHLRHAFGSMEKRNEYAKSTARIYLDRQFNRFKDQYFRPMVKSAIHNRAITIASALAVLIVVAGLVAGGRLGFTFFPNIEGRSLFATASFTAGSPPEKIDAFLNHLEQTLYQTEKEFGTELIETAVVRHGLGQSAGGRNVRRGNQHGSVMVEMISSEKRDIRNTEFMNAWEKKVTVPPGVESFTISERRAGHPGRDIDIRLTGDDAFKLKAAATEIAEALKTMPGVSAIEDDLPWGQEQFIFSLTPTGKALGLNVDIIGRQLRAAFDGNLVQLFQDRQDEVEVRVMLPDAERHNLAQLESLMIILPNGETTPLAGVVSITTRKSFEVLRHSEGQLAVSVSADVDRSVNNNNTIRANIRANFAQRLASQYGTTMAFQGRAEDQASTISDLKRGALFALIFIYIVLAWVFSSYSQPLIVMAVIPFGLVGAIIGHWVMNIELTILSLFGFFGLSGIVVNDSIILVTFYQKLRAAGMAVNQAVVEASCQRLRAVLLTSLTTIAGLTPLLFETSLQAQFLIPMAVTICFGLAFSTLLVLVVMPAFLSVLEHIRTKAPAAATASEVN
ncbi:MAG: efflux RND transporter permease subunit [Gammaproteobacteria bacterium]|nr:efflux RND transporter permease subunit [Gammaproteobacteria bacterium]